MEKFIRSGKVTLPLHLKYALGGIIKVQLAWFKQIFNYLITLGGEKVSGTFFSDLTVKAVPEKSTWHLFYTNCHQWHAGFCNNVMLQCEGVRQNCSRTHKPRKP